MIDYLELGGTLFVPATHKNLYEIVNEQKFPNLRSVVIDTEDSLSREQLAQAFRNVQEVLNGFKKTKLYVFIRPRNMSTLQEMLKYNNIDQINGFVLPKFSLENADSYFKILEDTNFSVMPSIEGSELFDTNKLKELRDKLLINKEKIILVRFGLEDMLSQLQMRRACEDSIFDFSVTNAVLGNFIGVFKSSGFGISGGVYPCFDDDQGFTKDVLRDLKEGLFTKTIIHPRQIELINEIYKVEKKHLEEALEVCNSTEQVFTQEFKMAEKLTMQSYSEYIISRAKIYGTL